MTHLTEETLVELQLGDAVAPAAALAHLAECAECRAHRDEIAETLAAANTLAVPERGEEYGAEVWARLEPRLPRRFGRTAVRRFPAFLGLAAALVAAFFLGRHTNTPVTPVATAKGAPAPGVVRERILLVAVGDHLDRSQMVLIELANATASPGGVDVSAERAVASDLVGEGRLFRQAAAHTDEPGVADVLDELERVLIEVARGPARLDGDALSGAERTNRRGSCSRYGVGSRVRAREQDGAGQVYNGPEEDIQSHAVDKTRGGVMAAAVVMLEPRGPRPGRLLDDEVRTA